MGGEANILLQELDKEKTTISSNAIGEYVIGQKIIMDANTNSQTLHPITVSSKYPYLSSITKVIPSPDWFSGFFNVDIRASRGSINVWYEQFVVVTFPWDAGTKYGNTYERGTSTTTIQQSRSDVDGSVIGIGSGAITQMTPENIPNATGPFLSSRLTDVYSVLHWDCKLLGEVKSETDKGSTFSSGTSSSFSVLPILGVSISIASILLSFM